MGLLSMEQLSPSIIATYPAHNVMVVYLKILVIFSDYGMSSNVPLRFL